LKITGLPGDLLAFVASDPVQIAFQPGMVGGGKQPPMTIDLSQT
jgi:hypothetical protein